MKFNKFISLLSLVLAIVQGISAQTASTSAAAQAALVTEFDVNGFKVLVKKRTSSPTVAVGLFIRGGSRNIKAENAGIEDFMLSAATEGSVKYPREVLRRELASTGSGIGSSAGYDFSAVSLQSTREAFDKSWDIFTDIILHPAFANESVEQTRDRLVTGLRNQEDDPDNALQTQVDKVIYAKTPYANDPNGTVETITRLTAADLKAYHQQLMQTSRLLLVVVGDVDPAQIRTRVEASLGKLPRGNYTLPTAPVIDFSRGTVDITSRTLPTNYIEGIYQAPPINDPDYYAMRVAVSLLNDRLFEEVRVKRNLSYAPSAGMNSLSGNTGNIYVTAVDANRTIGVMLDEINRLQTTAVAPTDISGVRSQFLTTYFVGEETNAAQAAELARYELIGGGWRNAMQFLDKASAVTAADVQRVAQKYMKNIRFIVVGNPSVIDRAVFLRG
ncbi:MAG: insulinase family protein [Acidobacteria bacterium]|nr:insulinase family protein [Acidobacteriota bacterium]